MARINIEDALLGDARFKALSRAVGGEDAALGMCVRAFRVGLKHWGDGRLVPERIWKIEGLEPLIEVDLAERREEGVYVRGSERQFEWYRERQERASAGGKKSARVRLEKYGTAIPRGASNEPPSSEAKTEAEFGAGSASASRPPEAAPNPPAPAPAPALTTSSSCGLRPLGGPESPPASGPPVGGTTTITPRDLARVWNEHRGGLTGIGALTPKRVSLCRERIREHPTLAFWVDVVRRLAASPVSTGKVISPRFPNGWRATFFWLIENADNALKVAEGRFDEQAQKKPVRLLTAEDL